MVSELKKYINRITTRNVTFHSIKHSEYLHPKDPTKFLIIVYGMGRFSTTETLDVTLLSHWQDFTPSLVQHEGLFYFLTIEKPFIVATLV